MALTQQDVTTRFDVVGTATYTLVPIAGGPPAASGVVRSITGYSAPESPGRLGLRRPGGAATTPSGGSASTLADGILQRLALSAGDWT